LNFKEAEMAQSLAEQAQFYREKADDLRALAQGIHRQPDRAEILALAVDYERLARSYEERATEK
jgi:hypothetical protein